MKSRLYYQFILHIIIFIWGFTAILGKFIEANAFVLVWYRVVIAFVSLILVLAILRKPLRIRSKRLQLQVLGVGNIVALHWLFFYLSIKESTASLAIICLATTTLHVAWLEPIVMKRKVLLAEWILGITIVLGIFLITQGENEGTNWLGIVYGLIAALMAAFFGTFNAYLVNKTDAAKITLYEMLSATVVMTIILGAFGDLTTNNLSISLNDFLLLLFLGIVCTSVAFLVTVYITKFLGAFTVSLSINMEPIYTLGLAAWLLQEHKALTLQFYLGALIIVGAVFANALLKRYQSKQFKKDSQSLV